MLQRERRERGEDRVAEERDHLRAQIIRARLKVLPKPDISKLATDSGNGSSPASSEQ